jgi:hypothetical protein
MTAPRTQALFLRGDRGLDIELERPDTTPPIASRPVSNPWRQ